MDELLEKVIVDGYEKVERRLPPKIAGNRPQRNGGEGINSAGRWCEGN
jgi:hypothetical protein